MSNLRVGPKALLRLPRFSFKDELIYTWEDLKVLIKDASPDFFDVIKSMTWKELCSADEKIQITARKYFNRACYRATPFAAFASVSLVPIDTGESALNINREPSIFSYQDWQAAKMTDVNYNVEDEQLKLFANSSYYRLQDEIRFIQRFEGELQISAVEYDPLVMKVLANCAKPIRFIELLQTLGAIQETDFKNLVIELLDAQLLFTSLHPNIIGQDYFDRVNIPRKKSDKKYIIAARSVQGTLGKKQVCHLPELATTLNRIVPTIEQSDLRQFKQDFLRRFDQAEIPIMLALDPEAGVGYGGREQIAGPDFLDGLVATTTPIADAAYVQLKENIYQKLLQAGAQVALEELFPNSDHNTNGRLPNTLAAGCTISGDELYLDYLGGASVNSILGRFAFALPDVLNYCKQIADSEISANPDVILFDVGYTKEGHADNINRRPAIYNYQVNLLNYDTSQHPLLLTDITVSVQSDEVVLRSRSLNKRLLPRMATAYNYQRADLSVFRLLMDIQSQGIHTSLSLHLPSLLPGLNRYPRVTFKNIVVSPGAWRISATSMANFSISKPAALLEYLTSLGTGAYVKTGTGDQTLCLSVESAEDMSLLVHLLEKEKSLLIEEVPAPNNTDVIDEYGAPYLPQVVVTLEHDSSIITPLTSVQQHYPATAAESWIPPGKEWLYFQIYCSPFRSDEVLLKINYLLQENRGKLLKWFFIRYDEGGDHIRLRLKLKNCNIAYPLINDISETLQQELTSGVVTDIKLCTYKREIQRYLSANMDIAESHFHIDSEYCISVIENDLHAEERYHLSRSLFLSIAGSGLLQDSSIDHLINKMVEAYNTEHNIGPKQFKEINSKFKEFKATDFPALTIQAEALRHRFIKSFFDTLETYPKMIRPKIVADLFHMHINRLFQSNMRSHEMLIYNFIQLSRKEMKYRKSTVSNTR